MKNKKIYTLIGFIVIISIFMIVENFIIDNQKKIDTVDYPSLSDPDSFEEIWNRTWISGDNYVAYCTAIQLDALGNIYLGGSLYNNDASDREIALVKYDKMVFINGIVPGILMIMIFVGI